jgi:serine/threonine protein kinase
VKWLSDAVLSHLCAIVDGPDLTGTRYELVGKIGQGGMGGVYLVHDRALDRHIALKVLGSSPAGAEAQARMEREACIMAGLEHPNIVPVHDAGLLADGRFYYAMKLVRGHRLDEQGASPQSLAERLQLVQKICDAVAFAHANGILHRDLKPQNVMLGAFGEVLVMDWGVAKRLGDYGPAPRTLTGQTQCLEQTQTAHGTVIGTPGYMAPEQARGEVDGIDVRTDVYGVGGILYFVLTGQAPAPDVLTDSGLPAAAPLVPPRHHDRSIPRPLEAVCMKALAQESSDRYATVGELAADIAAFLAGRRVRAYPEGSLETALRLGKKYRAVLGLVLAYLIMRILLLLVAGP